ncbi:3-deoxy-7-phosphoheptulonate synthase [Arthrobacter sp. TES]|uniref:Phospho-2-dehydro-3-deoxyheptonate aldolase n=1 Tax=Paenarthrobacter ureafaciens TaxID=37931 RepID=A0AAX3EI31_PAEUR|nr:MULTISPECIES: 3-deoxy-7-phosphoheptulonate synthase [Paenarthrobacter]AOY70002.1 phospho-2-dehydro-3-deoxyheptonate aldolase [Arthrobacter sp. ZXY-2]ERI35699.1 phospho-2-dehydro-3-deoxyheptonate aldolase [Arthrobacter sp. AK-YN10]NKR10727.1 phospho-2-dehydro-3-deoxyheptonate aldolase [Arthrobacter sp. M5]NKR16553.1 phospho-2-dehydro-3-deoxyheptonate aldolase [Arthrobacter sp. M6]OEH60457.1 phospho-2-dehydro-3-deoxyheptonate aldolase [Arthrobacter sp. D4]OEH61073.1 phospho-2-dehydro-3-deoxy
MTSIAHETAAAAHPVDALGAAQPATSNLRVARFEPLPAPQDIIAELPLDARSAAVVDRGRDEVRAVMDGVDDRLLVIVGPCSIHDPKAGLEYARRLVSQAEKHKEDLLIVMRTYFEKPRTTVGWKGLINDPHLDGSHDIASGLRAARGFLKQVTSLGLPTATEFLEPISPQYMADLVSWGAIGARTTESQIHRQLASGLSMPIGFKNGTDGDLQVAIDACGAAAAEQAFLGIDDDGRAALVATAGNPDTHVILRGGRKGPNYSQDDVAHASEKLSSKGLNPRLIVDASHANSGKSHHRQAEVALEIGAQLESDPATPIAGVMLESFLVGGAQNLDVAKQLAGEQDLVYGQSVTDACMEWDVTASVLEQLAASARKRRLASGE